MVWGNAGCAVMLSEGGEGGREDASTYFDESLKRMEVGGEAWMFHMSNWVVAKGRNGEGDEAARRVQRMVEVNGGIDYETGHVSTANLRRNAAGGDCVWDYVK